MTDRDTPGSGATTDPLERAMALHRDGRLAEARPLYQDLLKRHPDHPDALHLLGVLACQATPGTDGGRDGVALIARALALRPDQADFHANHARALAQAGAAADALSAARRAWELAEGHGPLVVELAARAGDVGAVLTALATLAQRALAAGRRDEARHWYHQTLAVAPDDALALTNLGETLRQDGDYAGALPHLRRAVAVSGGAVLPGCALADTLLELGAAQEALALLENLAIVHTRAPPAQALALNRALGQVRRLCGDTEGALAAYEAAATLAPDDAASQTGRAMSLLRLGRYREGFAAYAWRWRLPAHPPRHTDLPRWNGRDPAGLDLLVWHEQGVGDTLQCLRFLPALAKAGARITLEVPAPLAPLLREAPGLAGMDILTPSQVAARRPAPTSPCQAPPWQAQIPFMDLAGLFCPDHAPSTFPPPAPPPAPPPPGEGEEGRSAIPTPLGILAPSPERAARWRNWLDTRCPAHRPRVGLFWQGNPDFPEDRWRSPGLTPLLPLLARADLCFISLQRGGGGAPTVTGSPGTQMAQTERIDARMVDAGAAVADWADTAAVMAGLDLIIGSDTACLHLAGSLGKPTWLILSTTTDWRWHDGRADSPWYPDVRIFRQDRLGDWSAPVRAVAEALEEWRPRE